MWKSAAEARRPSFQRLAVQIVFRSNSRHGIGLKGFAGLRKVLYRTLVAHYLYDATGQRVKKLVRKQGGQFDVTVYVDGIFEYQRTVKAGTVAENNTIHVMDDKGRTALVRVGNPFPDDASPAVKYQLGDHLGSSNVVVDDSGAVVNREEYAPYGETSFGTFARKRYRFTGKERDEESGFYYHGARYYSPWFAAWPSCDPAGMTDGASLYTYARSNPIRFADPSGGQSDDPKIRATKVGDVWELPEVKITGILPTAGDGGYTPNPPGGPPELTLLVAAGEQEDLCPFFASRRHGALA